jgi:hypothetical protein
VHFDVDMDLVLNHHLRQKWTDKEPFDFHTATFIGVICAQLACDKQMNRISIVFLDAGISIAALLAATSFTFAQKHLRSSNEEHEEPLSLLCCATTEEIYYPDVGGKDFAEFTAERQTEINNTVYPRFKADE